MTYSVETPFTGTPEVTLSTAEYAAVQFILIESDMGFVGLNASAFDSANPDGTSISVSLTYTDATTILGIVGHRDRTVSPGASYTGITLNTTNSAGSGNDASVSSFYDATPGASPVTVDGTLSSTHDWTIVGLALTESIYYEYEDQSDLDTWVVLPVQYNDDEAGGEVVSHLAGLPHSTSVKIRTLHTSVSAVTIDKYTDVTAEVTSTISGTNSGVESSAVTTLTPPSRPGIIHYPGHLGFYNWSYPNPGNRVTGFTTDDAQATLYAKQTIGSFDANTSGLSFLALVSAKTNPPVEHPFYILLNEFRQDGLTGGPDGEPEPETGVNHLGFDTQAVNDFIALAQSDQDDYDETMFLHSSSTYNPGTRLIAKDGDKWIMNPASTEWRHYQRKTLIRHYNNYGDAAISSGIRMTGIAWDNVDVRPRPNVGDNIPDEYGTLGESSTFRTDVSNQLDFLKETGVKMIGNVIGSIETSGVYEVEHVAVHLDGAFLEAILRGYTGHHSAAQILENWEGIERLRDASGNGLTGFTYPADYELWLVGQMTDTTTAATSAGQIANLESIWAAGSMVIDTERKRVYTRGTDADSGGYDRIREIDAWNTATGNPTGARTFDSSSGTAPDGIYKRSFANGTLYYNASSTDKSSTDTGVGTLGGREYAWVAAPAASTVVGRYRKVRRIEHVDVTIPISNTTSNAAFLEEGRLVGMYMPDGWDAADITLLSAPVQSDGSEPGSGSYFAVYNTADEEITITEPTAGFADTYISLEGLFLDGLGWTKIVASASQTTAARTVTLVFAIE